MAISGFVAFSRPIVVVRSAPGGAEQNDPAPWVGYTGVPSGRAARRRNDWNWARAKGSVISGDTRSVRAAAPTINDPRPGVLEDVGDVLVGMPRGTPGAQGQPTQINGVPVGQAQVLEAAGTSRRPYDPGTVTAGKTRGTGDEVGMQVRLGRDRHPQAAPIRCRIQAPKVQTRVDRQRPAVPEINQIGLVAQPLVQHRHH
jgi:hypothetical protein